MLTPITWRDRIALLAICLLGIGALIGLLPWAARHSFFLPPGVWSQLEPWRRRTSDAPVMAVTPVVVGVAVVTLCLLLYGMWMSYWMSRPIVLQRSRKRSGNRNE